MKKTKYLIFCGLLLALTACSIPSIMKKKNACDDGHCGVDLSKKTQKKIEEYQIALKEGHFIESNFNEINNKAQNKESFYVLYTFATCPWCQQLMPILKDVSKELNQEIFYVTVRDQDNNDLRKNDNLEYMSNFNLVKDLIKDKIYVPALFKFEKGQAIKIHEGTVKDHDASKEEMSTKQKQECYELLLEMFK